jgi:hypothetical protein
MTGEMSEGRGGEVLGLGFDMFLRSSVLKACSPVQHCSEVSI